MQARGESLLYYGLRRRGGRCGSVGGGIGPRNQRTPLPARDVRPRAELAALDGLRHAAGVAGPSRSGRSRRRHRRSSRSRRSSARICRQVEGPGRSGSVPAVHADGGARKLEPDAPYPGGAGTGLPGSEWGSASASDAMCARRLDALGAYDTAKADPSRRPSEGRTARPPLSACTTCSTRGSSRPWAAAANHSHLRRKRHDLVVCLRNGFTPPPVADKTAKPAVFGRRLQAAVSGPRKLNRKIIQGTHH